MASTTPSQIPQPASPAPYVHDWGLPNIKLPIPISRKPVTANIIPWGQLQFTPVSGYDLCRHIGAATDEFGRFNFHQSKFLAADQAWLASGASDDGKHEPDRDKFHPELLELYESVPSGLSGRQARAQWGERLRHNVFDLVTKWDRAFGGTTMVLHVDGTTVPGAPPVPERLRAHCYIPPRFLADYPEAHGAISSIVQTFIEEVGVPTVIDWKHRASLIWTMNSTASDLSIVPPVMVLIPPPTGPGSAYYIFPSRPTGSLPPTAAVHDIDDITRDEDALMEAVDRAEILELDNDGLRSSLRHAQGLLETRTADFEYRIHVLESDNLVLSRQIARLENDLRMSRVRIVTLDTASIATRTSPTTPIRGAPPPYVPTTPSRLGSQARSGSPWREASSPRDDSGLGDATQEFLRTNGLMHLTDALSLLVRVVRPALWSTELARFSALPVALQLDLLEVLDGEAM
ncbi:hypothetical protein C8R43DRAFT_1135531 [Mycena crocata]|nr:hypothetical protein C8R43DRAFT_1135531 [Mycena crocata]